MSSIEQQIATQLANIEKSTGRSVAEWTKLIRESGLYKHDLGSGCAQPAAWPPTGCASKRWMSWTTSCSAG